MDWLEALLEGANKILGGRILPAFLLFTGVFFLVKLRFCIFRPPRRLSPSKSNGGFRALTMALAGTLGVGNISGVALAIALGGAGAIFWMWVSAFAAMALKYAEITLAMAHKRQSADGEVRGGAMYYVRDTIGGKAGRVLGGIFALLCLATSLTMGGMMQSNAAAETAQSLFSVPPIATGALLCGIVAFTVFGGAKKISALTLRMIPLLTIIYVAVSLWIVFTNITRLPSVFWRILSDAFSPAAAGGGFLGVLFSRGMRFGVTRGLLSNEAGCGTAPMAHATAKTEIPARQGLFGVAEVAIDTLLLCTLTALVILIAFEEVPVASGVLIAVAAYGEGLGPFAAYFIGASLTVFALGTAICFAYYGETGVAAVTKSRAALFAFRILYCLILPLGAVFTPDAVWGLSDLFLALLALINLTTLLLARKEIAHLSAPLIRK